MNRILTFIFGLLMAQWALAATVVTWVNEIQYELDYTTKTATVTYEILNGPNYSSLSGPLSIPETIEYQNNVFTVTAIGDYAFRYCEGITSLEIPTTVTSIGNDAFYQSYLPKVVISDLEAWCNIDFKNYYSNPLASNPFNNTTHFYIGENEVTDLVIPKSITSIGQYTFYHCNMTSVEIHNSVTSIGTSAFGGCKQLVSINLPQGLTEIGYAAFSNCEQLVSISIPEGVTEIPQYCFENCSSLTQLTLPASVNKIGSSAFDNCTQLASINIPDGVTEIPYQCFYRCESLTQLTLPSSVNKIGDWAFYLCNKLASINIPDGVTEIPVYCLRDCPSLTQLTLPSSVNKIDKWAFSGCSKLSELTCLNPEPASCYDSDVFGYDFKNKGVLYVPAKSVEAYKAADGWKEIKKINPMGPDLTSSATLAIEAFEIDANETKNVSVNLDGEALEYAGFQFDIELPAGLSISDITLNDALKSQNFSITSSTVTDGTTRIISFTGTGGKSSLTEALVSMNVTAADDAPDGTATIQLKNVKFSSVDAREIYLEDSEATVTIHNIKAETVTLSAADLTMLAGTAATLTATVSPENTTDKSITWASASPETATVTQDGRVTALKPGTASITATCGTVSGTCLVTVVDPTSVEATPGEGTHEDEEPGDEDPGQGDKQPNPGENTQDGGSLTGNDLTLRVNQTAAIQVKIDPELTYDPELQWSLGDGGNACVTMTVNEENSLTATFRGLAVGKTTYTVSTPGNSAQILTGNINVIAENPVLSLTVEPAEISIAADAQPCQLDATATPDDATVSELFWSSDDTAVATVDQTGKVTPVAAGECTVTVTTTDGTGLTATCRVTVNPIPQQLTITCEEGTRQLKVTETCQLTATVLPADTPYRNVIWSAQPADGANVNDGLVTALKAGEVTVTAAVEGYPDVYDTYVITVVDRLLGDANDNGDVSVADAVATADYIIHIPVYNFNFANANVVEDDVINTDDVTGIVNIILTGSPTGQKNAKRRLGSTLTNDRLIVDDFSATRDEALAIGVELENSVPYTALQASVRIPEGMTVEGVTAGPRAAGHSLFYNVTDEGSVEIVLFSLGNQPFADADGKLFNILVKADGHCGNIEVEGVHASDASTNGYDLLAQGGFNQGVSTGLDTLDFSDIRVTTDASGISVYNAEGLDVRVFTVAGATVAARTATAVVESFRLDGGVYIVSVDGKSYKVIVK